MHACLDACYEHDHVTAACVLFHDWPDPSSAGEITAAADRAAPYQPGRFYLRELPALLVVLSKVTDPLETVIVDGYVWLDERHTPGLGAHLYAALGRATPVIGVAKTAYRGAPAEEILRGRAHRPLYVSSAGIPPVQAAERIRAMHGPYRVPTLLRRADALCRG